MQKRGAIWLVSFTILFGIWLLLAGSVAWHEVVVGLAAAGVATVISELVRGQEHPRIWPHARWFLELWALPWEILSGCWVVASALIRGEPGLLHEVPFESGGDDRRSSARRAMAIAFTSISPNSMIIDIDRERGVMLIHNADHGPVPRIARYLGEAR